MFLSIVDSVVAPSPWPAVTAVPPDRECSQYHGLGDAATAAWWYSLVTNLLLLSGHLLLLSSQSLLLSGHSLLLSGHSLLLSSQSLVLSGQSLLNLPGSLPLLLQLLLYLCDVVATITTTLTALSVTERELSMSHLLQLMYHTLIHCSTPPF